MNELKAKYQELLAALANYKATIARLTNILSENASRLPEDLQEEASGQVEKSEGIIATAESALAKAWEYFGEELSQATIIAGAISLILSVLSAALAIVNGQNKEAKIVEVKAQTYLGALDRGATPEQAQRMLDSLPEPSWAAQGPSLAAGGLLGMALALGIGYLVLKAVRVI